MADMDPKRGTPSKCADCGSTKIRVVHVQRSTGKRTPYCDGCYTTKFGHSPDQMGGS